MGKVEIIKLAREVGAIKRYWGANKEGFAFESDTQLERFAALVREDEANKWKKDLREAIEAQGFCYACAKALDDANEKQQEPVA